MTCTDIASLLDDYLDGALSPEQAAAVVAHLSGCERCRAEAAGIQRLLAEARSLPRAVAPGRELWGGIAGRLVPRAEPPVASLRLRTGLPRALLALAAGVALLLTGALLATWYQRQGAPIGSTFALEQERYTRATADLARSLSRNPAHLPAETRAVVERNLAIVDQAIREAEAALATDPGNAELEQMVLARYAQRLALLERATESGRQES